MVKNSLVFLAFCAGLSAQMPTMQAPDAGAPQVPVGDPNAVVISVGDHTITAGQFMEFVKALPQQYQDTARGPGRRDFAKNLVELQVLAGEALKQGLDKKPDVKTQMEFQRDNMLAQAMFLDLQQSVNVSDADIQTYYDAHKAD